MAFLFSDSFDHYTTTADIDTKYPSGSRSGATISAGNGRRSSASLRLNANPGTLTKVLTPGDATMITGFAFKPAAMPGTSEALLRLNDSGGVTHVEIRWLSTGAIEARRDAGGTLLGTSAAGVIDHLTGYHAIEIKITVSDTVGVVVVKVNGTTVLNLTGQDTRNAGVLGWARVMLRVGSNLQCDIDDWWILDGTGSINNDFLGDQRVDAHYPNANGTSNGSTPSTGTDRFATVDEAAPNSDTDYNTVTGVGDKDTLNIQSLANAGATPTAVQVALYTKKTDAGAGSLCAVARQDGVDYDGTSIGADTAYGYKLQPYDQAPDGTPWTEADFNAMEIGYKRTA